MASPTGAPTDVPSVLARLKLPTRAVVTAGMPYANGPLHLGHLAGAHIPADVHARYLGMAIGREQVMFVCGTDEHGSTTELAARAAGVDIRAHLDAIHDAQEATLRRYHVGLDTYSGTSRPDCLAFHRPRCQSFMTSLQEKGLLFKRESQQWFDPELGRFLPDRFVRGTCPNPKCGSPDAYSDECGVCGHQHEPSELLQPRSVLSDATPVMRGTVHLWLDMWSVSETLRAWVQSKQKTWRKSVLAEVVDTLLPALRFERDAEATYKDVKAELPKHKQRFAPGGRVELVFADKAALEQGRSRLVAAGVEVELADGWAYRAITRDIAWGIPVPGGDPDLEGKTLYVWPDSLLAPVAFTEVALQQQGHDPARVEDFWCREGAAVYQFLGQDNVFFYVLMQGAMWLGMQDDPQRMPVDGELRMSDVFGCFHLLVNGEKMSKTRGNFFTGDQLLDEQGYDADQIRYYLCLLGLPEKPSDFDFEGLGERNKFLAGPMNAAFEKPLSAAHSKFEGRVPEGTLIEDVERDTLRMVQRYVRAMEKASYPSMLYELENYARKINALFTKYKPHDDRHPEQGRKDALYSAFYVLKSLMIMLYPFVPATMERLRESLALPEEVFRLHELGTPLEAGHVLGAQQPYFPAQAEGAD